MSKEPKHHYLPRFYLEQWADDRKRLIEYSRQGPGNFVKARPTSPRGTGYVRGLNTIPGGPLALISATIRKFGKRLAPWFNLWLPIMALRTATNEARCF
jgi:hypothetical protein